MAHTPQEKREIMQQLLALWSTQPHLRLGQLLVNAVYKDRGVSDTSLLFYSSDEDIVSAVRSYSTSTGQR